MESLLILLLIYLAVAVVLLPIWTIIKIRRHDADVEALRQRLSYLDAELKELRAKASHATAAPAQPSAPVAPPSLAAVPPVLTEPPPLSPAPIPFPGRATLPDKPLRPASTDVPPLLIGTVSSAPTVPPPLSPPPPLPPPPALNLEQFMGARLFAWLGGLALFLGVVFFVKYSFEHDLVPPEVRVAIGFVTGLGLIIGGMRVPRDKYAVTAQTLIAAGIVSLYAVTFAAGSIYRFAAFSPVSSFLLMALITSAAFTLAVRLRAQVVAILGLLGGFLTPPLLSTGIDNPLGLFGYLALLDLGLVAAVLHTGWRYLVPLSAGGTVLLIIGWATKFLNAGKVPVAMIVCLGFAILYLAAAELARRRQQSSRAFSLTAAAMPLLGYGFALVFLLHGTMAAAAPRFLAYVLALDVILIALAWRDDFVPRIHLVSGLAAFALLGLWTGTRLTDANLLWALAFYLLFAALHTALPLWLDRVRPGSSRGGASQLFAPLTLLLLLLPIYQLDPVPFVIWPAILLIDVLAIGLALATASLGCVVAVLILTVIATGLCLFRLPAGFDLPFPLLLVIGGFAAFFFAGSFWLARRLENLTPGKPQNVGGVAQLPALSSLLPFLLLILACARLAVPNPSMIFGLALLLVLMALALALVLRRLALRANGHGSPHPGGEWLPLSALLGVAALEAAWHARHFTPAEPALPMAWYLAFHALFAAFPFTFRRTFADTTGPWAAAALSGIVTFPLVHRVVVSAAPNEFMGLLPTLFAIPPLLSLVAIFKTMPADNSKRLDQLAWFGGTALFFLTLIFPLQFERQWITLGWALEGVALLWLFHRVPHPGLRGTGVVLLVVAFVRLACNDAVFSYQVRGDTPILNWYLYAYGIVIVALFVGAKLLAPPRERTLGLNAPALLNTLGVVLAFVLLNLQIADFFTAPGARSLAFSFRGNFARDMTYTIAWALFALALLGAGIWKNRKAARYAAIALLSVALAKLFLHDLARLQALYRVGALVAVAIIAMLASFAYQRFLPSPGRRDDTP